MKLIGLSCALIVILSMASGCSSFKSTERQADEFDDRTDEQSEYFKDGKMDDQVQSWKKPGGRY